MPKTELHLHLEGAIPLDAMWQLVQRHGGDPEVPRPQALTERFAYRDFPHFIETWVWKNQFLDTYEAFEFAAAAVAADLSRQNIVYAEAFFSPTDFRDYGLTPEGLALAIRRGLDRVDGVVVALIVDLVRDTGPNRAAVTFDRVREVAAEAGVVGIGIGGSEADFPPEQFGPVYRKAADLGFHRTAHAGEAAGPESVRGALDVLGVDRIGHGVRSVEDPALLTRIVDAQIPFEVCPTSNLRTGVVASWDGHPVRDLIDRGAVVTVNSDDPAMFDCTLDGEYRALRDHLGLDGPALWNLARAGIDSSWASSAMKAELRADLDAWWRAR
jgi:adenosine deaminase